MSKPGGLKERLRDAFDRLARRRPGALLFLLVVLFGLFALFHFPSRNQALESVRIEGLRELDWQATLQETVGTSALPVADLVTLKEILGKVRDGTFTGVAARRLEQVAERNGGATEDEQLRRLLKEILETTRPLTFDVRSGGYSQDDAKVMLTALGADGRRLYLQSQIAFDMAFPLVYALLAIVLLAYLTPDSTTRPALRRHLHWGALAPLAMAAVDLIENWLSVALVSSYESGLSPIMVKVASLATRIKFLFGGLTVALLVALFVWKLWRDRSVLMGRLRASAARLVPYVMLIRVQLIFAAVLLLLARLGASSLPTIENLMIVETWGQMAVMTLLCFQAGGILGFTLLLTWDYADKRFGVEEVQLPTRLARPGVARTLWFALLGLPLVIQIAVSSSTPPNGRLELDDLVLGFSVGVVAACAVAGAVALGLHWLQHVLRWVVRRAPRTADLLEHLGPGYVEDDPQRGKGILPAHVLATVGVTALAFLYLVGFFLLDPRREGFFVELHPTLAFVLVMLIFLDFILAGASFFFDRYRVPVLLAVVLYMAVMALYVPRDHYFDVTLAPRSARPAPSEASQARWEHTAASAEGGQIVTLVTLDGGGIQAGAWAAEVLAGLHAAFGEEFTNSVAFISSVSGGSVGALFYLEGLDPETGLPEPAALDAVRWAAAQSSLEATAWGLAYPDFLRGVLPFVDVVLPGLDLERRDRAWAMERAWARTVSRMRDRIEARPGAGDASSRGESRLSDWARRARSGSMPGVVLNATVVEDGQQFWASNLELAELDRPATDERPPVADPALSRHYAKAWTGDGPPLPLAENWLDMTVLTGARLSATFPWVTPIARARLPREEDPSGWVYEPQLPAHHVADGGYFDNFGTVAALSWLNRTVKAEDVRRVLFIEVRSFALDEPEEPATDRGWAFATLGPLQALLRVRTSSQAGRNDLEIELARQIERWSGDAELEHVVIRPPRIEYRPEPPLSWHLSRRDKRQVCRDWLALRPQIERDFAGLFQPIESWPGDRECDIRMD